MYHLNNHFEKSVIILVITMFLTIPNIHMYSFVGKYRTTSPALTANASKFVTKKERFFFNIPAIACLAFTGAIVAVVCIVAASEAMVQAAIVSDSEVIEAGSAVLGLIDDGGEQQPLFSITDKYYGKHDFSRFDN